MLLSQTCRQKLLLLGPSAAWGAAFNASSFTTTTHRQYSAIRPHILPGSRIPHGKYGGRSTVVMLAGDGIGPEMMDNIRHVFKVAHIPVDFEEVQVDSSDASDASIDNAITAIQRNGVAIKGNIETKFDNPIFKSRNVELRRRLDLYANVLHCVSIPSVPTRHRDLDIVLMRENTEGEYSGLEHMAVNGVVESLKIVTRKSIERIAKFTFEYALLNHRKKITAVHKANIQKLGDGLFLQVCRELSESEPYKSQIAFDAMIVDNASMQLVSRPEQFNGGILLMPNLYGNIISNIACGLCGGPGLVSGQNVGPEYAVFETGTRNTGTSLAGRNAANPTAFIRASIDMLRYLELHIDADLLSDALFHVLNVERVHTADIGGTHRTSDVIDALTRQIKYLKYEGGGTASATA